jgi:hypothetical protein
VPAFGGIDVTWTYPVTNRHAVSYFKLYRGTTNVFNSAVERGIVTGGLFYDRVNTNSVYYYWISMVSVYGTEAEIVGPASAQATPLLTDLISELSGEVTSSLLGGALRTEIDQILVLRSDLQDYILDAQGTNTTFSEALDDVENGVADALTFIGNETSTRTTQYGALATQIGVVAVTAQDNLAAVQTLITASIDDQEERLVVLADRVDDLVIGAGTGISEAQAAINASDNARIIVERDRITALATTVTNVQTSIGEDIAAVQSTLATAIEAVEDDVTAVGASVTALNLAVGSPTTFTGAGITLEQALFGRASLTTGLFGNYGVSIGANGVVSGISLVVDAPIAGPAQSAFVVRADKFAVVSPSYSGTLGDTPTGTNIPFGVDASGVYINGQLRVNASGTRLQDLETPAGVKIEAVNGQVFVTPGNSTTPIPASTTVTATSIAVPSPTYAWTIDGVAQTTPTPPNQLVVPSFAAGLPPKVVRVVVTGSDSSTAQDTLSLFSLRDGSDAYAMGIENETQTVACDSSGTPLSGQLPLASRMVVVRGATELSSGVTYSVVSGSTTGMSGVSISATGVISVLFVTADIASVKFRAVIAGGPTLETWFKVFKSRAAVAGINGNTGPAGTRGTVQRYLSGYSAWDSAAASASVPGGVPIDGDTVAQYNGAGTFAQERTWNGASWVLPGVVINGDVLVNGSVSAPKINVVNLFAEAGNFGTLTSANINLSGFARINGATSVALTDPLNPFGGTTTCALVGNESGGSLVGLVGMTSAANFGAGVYGYSSSFGSPATISYNAASAIGGKALRAVSDNGTAVEANGRFYGVEASAWGVNGIGVYGEASGNGGRGVSGVSTHVSGNGVYAQNTAGGTALRVAGLSQLDGTLSVNGSASVGGAFSADTVGSTVSTGTAPFSVLSTTKVNNLNVSFLDGANGASYRNAANLTGSISAAQMAAGVIGAIGFVPVQQGTGTGQTGNLIKIGWSNASVLRLQIDNTDFGANWPINISGNASSASNATNASAAYIANSLAGTLQDGSSVATFVGTTKPGASNSNTWVIATVGNESVTWPIWRLF